MIEEAKRLKCDVCGKTTSWKEHSKEPVIDEEYIGWKSLNLKGAQYFASKDYCSKECVMSDLEDSYAINPPSQI